jgi:subtilisin family serine protease
LPDLTAAGKIMARLDAELELLLIRKEIFDKDRSAARLEVGPDELIRVSVAFTGDITALQKAGLQVGSASARIAYGATTLAGLQALAALPQVESIQRQRHPHPHLNDSVPDIKANQVWNITGDSFHGYTGRGVIVGIIDTGIDITHPNFRTADDKTRVIAIWDQTLTKGAGENAPGPITDPNLILGGQPTPLGYGVEYDIKNNPTVTVRHIDEDGHGTHVAGIAAGNGQKRGGCLIKYQYVGVAPEADIVVVRLFGLSKSDGKLTLPTTNNGYMMDAIRYILNVAKTNNQPAVINLSLGSFTEFMDGTSNECKDIDALLNANSTGRAIVFSSGNNGAAKFHASGTVPAGSGGSATPLALPFTIFDDDTAVGSRTLMVMYSGSNLQAQLTSPVSGAAGVVPWVSTGGHGISATANGPNGVVTIKNDANRITILIGTTQASAGPPPKYNPKVAGTWKLELRDTTNTATPIDAYCLYGDASAAKSPKFLSNDVSRSTLSDTATCHEAVAVGSCKVPGLLSDGGLSDFSARGPTLDAAKRTKPDLCAPGDNVTSAHSSTIPDDPDCTICCCSCCEAYVDKGGTSMAAPHIAGVIALMLHRDPNLKHDEITKALTDNAAPKPSGTSPDDDLGWGAGRVDADATMTSAAVLPVHPPVFAVAADPSIVPEALPQADPVLALRDELMATERGAELSQLFEQHATEVWSLINTNRRVAMVWHRCKGPIWVRLSLRAAHSPELPVPMQVDGLALHQAIERFARIMWRYASAPLQRDLQTYLPQVSILRDGMSVYDLIHAAGRKRSSTGANELPAPA